MQYIFQAFKKVIIYENRWLGLFTANGSVLFW